MIKLFEWFCEEVLREMRGNEKLIWWKIENRKNGFFNALLRCLFEDFLGELWD